MVSSQSIYWLGYYIKIKRTSQISYQRIPNAEEEVGRSYPSQWFGNEPEQSEQKLFYYRLRGRKHIKSHLKPYKSLYKFIIQSYLRFATNY